MPVVRGEHGLLERRGGAALFRCCLVCAISRGASTFGPIAPSTAPCAFLLLAVSFPARLSRRGAVCSGVRSCARTSARTTACIALASTVLALAPACTLWVM